MSAPAQPSGDYDVFTFRPGTTPLLLSIPHAGTLVPDDIAARFSDAARVLPDTDWHVDRLYDFAHGLGAGVLIARYSRYVIDLNRDPEGADLYAGADNTELVPLTTFDHAPIYLNGTAPDATEIAARLSRFWQPYHRALRTELAALKKRFGYALLYDAHSIRSRVPRFFAGELPAFNIGTAGGASAADDLARRLLAICREAPQAGAVLNGRFTGGYITRTYGAPGDHVHAVQMELAQKSYMNEAPPYTFDEPAAATLRPVLNHVLEAMLDWGRSRYRA